MPLELKREEIISELALATGRFEALLRAIKPEQVSLPVAGLEWNVGETAAHVLTVMRRALNDRRRSSNPYDLADLNALLLEEFSSRNPNEIADFFKADMDVVLNKIMPRIPVDFLFVFPYERRESSNPDVMRPVNHFEEL